MVNVTVTANVDAERALAFSYARPDRRAGLHALFALDDALGQVLRTTREPIVGQMRLAWWREALVRLDSAPAPAEPVLRALAADALPRGASGVGLAEMVDGWEPLLGVVGDAAFADHAERRGGTLFAQAGLMLGADAGDPLDEAGRGWALADLAAHLSDAVLASCARDAAAPWLSKATSVRWTRNARALGALAHSAQMNLSGSARSWRVGRLAWHRLTGR